MSNLPIDDSYNSDEDEDYVPPADAPPENENDAYLVDKSGDTNGIEAPTKYICSFLIFTTYISVILEVLTSYGAT